jgi:hypothetical protein
VTRVRRLFVDHFLLGGKYIEHRVIGFLVDMRTATASIEVSIFISLCGIRLLTSIPTPPMGCPLVPVEHLLNKE